MNLTKWIKNNRSKIDKYTQSPYKNDVERRLWVLNDEFLYDCCRKGWDL
jgi:hypothetical protein